MKNKLLILLVALLGIGFTSCENDTSAGLTGVTYYPVIKMNGDATVFVASGSTYSDAGASATENGAAISVVTTSNVDATAPGSYSVSYKATNVDGFSKTIKRSVIVYKANSSSSDISGSYVGDVVRNGTASYAGNPVTLTPTSVSGVYLLSDWIAGFYEFGRKYGPNYAFKGYLQIDSDNKVVLLSMTNPWGDPFSSVVGTYDPNTGEINYSAKWLSYTFVVKLKK